MNRTFFVTVSACVLLGTASAQTYQRRASMVGGGSPNAGKCTVEVVVDGAAEISIQGDRATLRNLNGRAPQWRRFDCTSPMPANAANIRFQGVDGRGRQELVRNPVNGGPAVIRIEDPDGGAEGYTFDITWNGGSGGGYQPYGSADRSTPGPYSNNDRGGIFGDYSDSNTAIAACQDAVRQEAARRYGVQNVDFRRERYEDEPGARDTVRGWFRAADGQQGYRFTCSVNTNNGRVRNVSIEPAGGRDDRGWNNNSNNNGALGGYRDDNRYANGGSPVTLCQRAAEQRISQDGYGNVSFGSTTLNSRRGRVEGTARAEGGNGRYAFEFGCAVDNSGGIQNVDVRRR